VLGMPMHSGVRRLAVGTGMVATRVIDVLRRRSFCSLVSAKDNPHSVIPARVTNLEVRLNSLDNSSISLKGETTLMLMVKAIILACLACPCTRLPCGTIGTQ
jgi:hypothetical protein